MIRQRAAWAAIALSVLALTYVLHAHGLLVRYDYLVAEARDRVLAHETKSDIVVVGIDPHSLQLLHEWPWPRRHHARLLQQLQRAGVASVFIDVDFSSASSDEDDELFEQSLAAWTGKPVMLASYWQARNGGEGELRAVRPLDRFACHAQLVSVVLRPSIDGLVHEMRSSWRIGGERLPSVLAAAGVPDDTAVPIDFSILPSSFGYVSYIDLLNAEVDFAALEGKHIFVGAIARELNDTVPVPVFKAGLPGVVVQALAAESAREGIVHRLPNAAYAALLTLWTALFAVLFVRGSWRRGALLLGAGFAGLAAVAVMSYAKLKIDIPIVPLGFASFGLFVAATLRSLDQETWRAVAYALGLKRRTALLKSIVDASSDCILCLDGAGTVRTANPAAGTLFGRAPDNLVGLTMGTLVPALGAAGPELRALSGRPSEHAAIDSRGRRFPVEISVSRVAVEDEELYTVIVRDITERQAHEHELERRATHDALTGLPNRAALSTYLEAILARSEDEGRVALLMLDLCRFKEVNDTLGHDVGDEVLCEVAHRLGMHLTGRAFVGRLGGDEFTVVVPGVRDRRIVEDLAQRLIESFKTPIHCRGLAIEVGLSIGIALYPDHASGAKELLRRADVAMYVAKRQGSAYEYYEPEHDRHSVRRLTMLGELRGAISRDEVMLHYQPQVNLQTGRCESAEALLRWNHAMFGNVSPAEFVTLAEATDLIRPLTDWVLRQSLADCLAWQRRGLELRLAVNLSARALQDVSLPRRLDALLAEHGVRPEQLELEITESAMLIDPERAKLIVRDLLGVGVSISIDDYGTGFSSLGYLRDLRVQALKLDRSFVTDVDTHGHNRVIVESTVHMAHALGLSVVAEGVETQQQCDYLRQIGYDVGQGYWFTRALAAEDCFRWVESFNASGERRRA
jgi:diguanylate cyclase (GGDEF)-like protein/PAS domain S-box-containing protein